MEQIKNENSNVMQAQMPAKKEKTPKAWKGIVGGVLVLLAFLAFQLAISISVSSVYAASCIAEAGGDQNLGTQLYMEKVTSTGFATYLTAATILLSGVIAFLWYKLVFVKKYASAQWQEFKQRVLHGRTIAILVFAAIGCYCIDVLIAGLIAELVPGSMETFQTIMGVTLGGNAILAFITVVILAPIAEELIFRGIIFQMLTRNHCPIVAAIIIQAVLFGIYHMNIMQSLYVLPLALLLGYTAYKCKSVFPCIFIHIVYNFMAEIIPLLPQIIPAEIVLIVLLVICVIAVYILGKKTKKQTS